LVGTKKGAFILSGDGQRKNREISGPHFAGREMHHLKGLLVDSNRFYPLCLGLKPNSEFASSSNPTWME